MKVLESAKSQLLEICLQKKINLEEKISVRPLTDTEAIGDVVGNDYAIRRGKEVVVECSFLGARGQSFTDRSILWEGTLQDAFSLNTTSVSERAVLVAVINAVMRYLELATGTVHCKGEDPVKCGTETATWLKTTHGNQKYGLIGLQPSLLENLSKTFGPENVRVLDLDEENIGKEKFNVPVWNGENDLDKLVDFCDIALVTGSTLVNATIDHILAKFNEQNKKVIFFGNTISGVARLLKLNHHCLYGN